MTTAVVTGSMSSPATTDAGSGCASVAATAFRITSAATLSSAIQIARGTWRAASVVSSDAATHASKPMNTQPPTASAASIPALTEPSDSASAPSVCVEQREVLRAERQQQRDADADGGDRLGADPELDRAAEHLHPERAHERADEDEHHAGEDDPAGRRVDPEQRQQPGRAEVGDRRVRDRVRADRHPAAEPAVDAAHQPPVPLVRGARHRELGCQLRVDRKQQALPGERDRQHPHPRGPGDDRADEDDGVQPDYR